MCPARDPLTKPLEGEPVGEACDGRTTSRSTDRSEHTSDRHRAHTYPTFGTIRARSLEVETAEFLVTHTGSTGQEVRFNDSGQYSVHDRALGDDVKSPLQTKQEVCISVLNFDIHGACKPDYPAEQRAADCLQWSLKSCIDVEALRE